jgi:ribokinase
LSCELLSFGDISTDVLVQVPHLPKQDEKVWAELVGEFPGGMGANVAAAFTTLGGTSALITNVGNDARGRAALADLRRRRVDVTRVTTVADSTFWTFALLDAQGEKSLVEFRTAAFSPSWESIDWSVLDGARIAYTTGFEGANAAALFHECRNLGITSALDIEGADWSDSKTLRDMVKLTDVLFCRPEYCRALTGAESLQDAAHELRRWGVEIVAVTLGAQGCAIFAEGDAPLRVAGHEVPVVDTTGAGDCFAGAFLFGHLRDWPLRTCAELANLMAAMSTTSFGCRECLLNVRELLELPQAGGLQVRGFDANE